MTHDETAGPVGEEPTGLTGDADDPTADPTADETAEVTAEHPGHAGQGAFGAATSAEPGGSDEYDVVVPDSPEELDSLGAAPVEGDDVHPDTRRAAERLEDLRRLQAEYVNYKKRVDRDRDLARDRGVTQVIEALLPVLDDIHAAREHGDLEGGPFSAIAEKLEGILARFGVQTVGAKGEEFDPVIHEALMHVEAELPEDATTTTVVQVIQPGFKMGERVVRAARVAVADPT